MLIVIYFSLALLLILAFKRKTPAVLALCIYLTTLAGSALLGLDNDIRDATDIVNVCFTAIVLTLLILPWTEIKYTSPRFMVDADKLRKVTTLLLFINGAAFFIFVICVYYGFSTVLDYSAVKNGDESGALFQSIPISNTLILLALYLHPTAYFLMPLHFHYLKTGEKRLAFFCLIFSMNLILQGLTVFSRSGFITYAFLYIFYIPFFYSLYDKKTKRLLHLFFGGVFLIFGFIFFEITSNRFISEVLYADGTPGNILKSNPIIYSVVDYGAQWYKNGLVVMSKYTFETFDGQLSFPFPIMVLDKIGLIQYSPNQIEVALYQSWKEYYDRFNGITANLLFDFGYFGTLIFTSLYWALVQFLGRKINGQILFGNFLLLGGAFVLVATGIFNYEMKSVYYNLLILYSIALYLYMNKKIRIAP